MVMGIGYSMFVKYPPFVVNNSYVSLTHDSAMGRMCHLFLMINRKRNHPLYE